MFFQKIDHKKDRWIIGITLFAVGLLFWLPGIESKIPISRQSIRALVLETDNSRMHTIGLVQTGEQRLKIKILSGDFEGQIQEAVNLFVGKMEVDKVYEPGDKIYAVAEIVDNQIHFVYPVDIYRVDKEIILFSLFALLLLFFAGWVGFKAILSFVFTALVIWKILLPGFLSGYSPIVFSLVIVGVFTGVILFLIAGFTKKGWTAFLGSLAGVLLTAFLSLIFRNFFQIKGVVKPYAESLLYSGFTYLDMNGILVSGIFIACSGAIMDLAMDIAAAQEEIVFQNPHITRKELIRSGFNIGRSVIGTMTTTLLLAYSGSYSTLLMVFMAKGIPEKDIFNYQFVASEILNTLVGSFGLITVAPLTAIVGGILFIRKKE